MVLDILKLSSSKVIPLSTHLIDYLQDFCESTFTENIITTFCTVWYFTNTEDSSYFDIQFEGMDHASSEIKCLPVGFYSAE